MSESEWKNTADHVVKCLNTFFGSDVCRLIYELKEDQWLDIEEFSHFIQADDKIYVKLDLAFRKGEKIIIYDWKSK